MLKLILIGVSFLFGVLSIRHLRQFDVHEEEPISKMIGVTIWGGLVSIVLSLFLYSILQRNGIQIRDGFPFSYIFIGLTEEGAKLAALFLCWGLIRKEMDEPTDGLIYMACVALGFSLIENYFYAARNPYTTPLIAIRLIICTPMHIAFSMLMGLAFFRVLRHHGEWGTLLRAYLFASIYHTLYNTFVSWWFLLPGIYLILRGAYGWMYRLLGYSAAKSPYRTTLSAFVDGQSPTIEAGMECLECGSTAPKPTFDQGRIRMQRCDSCGAMICSKATLRQLFHHYGSTFGRLKTHAIGAREECMRVMVQGNRYDRKKGVASFRLEEFNRLLEEMSGEIVRKSERKWWCRQSS